jgi:hypothetical protein
LPQGAVSFSPASLLVAKHRIVPFADIHGLRENLLGGDPFYRAATDIDVPRVRRALAFIFPGVGDGLAALEPDLIGEHHVAEVADDALVDACLAWAGENSGKRRQILTVRRGLTNRERGLL